MTPQVIDGVGGSSKGHNNCTNVIFDDICVDRNVDLDIIPDNMCEVTSSDKSNNVHLINLTSDPLGSTRGTEYHSVYQGDSVYDNSCVDIGICNTGRLTDIPTHVKCKCHNTEPRGTTLSDVHHTDHYAAHQVEPHPANPLITDSTNSKGVYQLACHPVTLFDTGFYNLINNSDIWYSYIHGYPCGSPGGFYYLEISRNSGHIQVFQCDVHPESHLNVWGSLNLYIQPVNFISYHTPQELLEARRVFDNYRRDLSSQHLYGLTYEAYMDQLIVKLSDHCDNDTDNTDNLQDLTLNQGDTNGGEVVNIVNTSNTRRSGIVNSPLCQDINYPTKTKGYIAVESTPFEFIGPDRAPIKCESVEQYLEMARIIRHSGLPNYKQVRFPLKSGLRIEAWSKYLHEYKDQKLIHYLQFGFPLSLTQSRILCNQNIKNHHSALQFENAVGAYLAKERSHEAILGPLSKIGHHPDYSSIHCSPILTRPKDRGKRRVILDLSYPKGLALNDQVDRSRFDGDLFCLKFPSIDDIVREICSHKDDAVIAKIDVARAFRNLRVDPADAIKLGISWGNDVYIDAAVAFGWVHGSAAFQRVSDAVTFIMANVGVKMFAYIDDYIIVSSKASGDAHFRRLASLLTELGLPSNLDKQTPPCRKLTCLGIQIDLDKNELSIHPEKLESIYTECVATSSKRHLSKGAFQSLLGKLLYIHKCVPPARVFINRMLALFRENSDAKKIILTNDFHKDLTWFLVFLPRFNGITYINKDPIPQGHTLHIDASLTGLGGVWNKEVYATPLFNVYQKDLTIVHLEMLNLVIALKLWAGNWAHSTVKFYCDNSAVVQVVQTGRTRDDMLALCLRNIWLISATYDITVTIDHIRGKANNIADLLSRIYSDKPVDQSLLRDLQSSHIWRKIPMQFFNLDISI